MEFESITPYYPLPTIIHYPNIIHYQTLSIIH